MSFSRDPIRCKTRKNDHSRQKGFVPGFHAILLWLKCQDGIFSDRYWEREGRGLQRRIDWYLRHFIVGGQLVVKSALADPGRNGLDLCGGEMAPLRHCAYAAVGSGQGLRHQAERRVEGRNERSPVATRLGWLIHDGSIIPRRVAHLA